MLERVPETTHCDDAMQALGAGAPMGERAAHLAQCPKCAALARAWEATRPIEPAVAAWDDVWAGVTASLDAQSNGVIAVALESRSAARVWMTWVARAAVVVAAVGLGWSQFGRLTPQQTEAPKVADSRPVSPARPDAVEIDAGEIVMLRDDGQGLHPVVLASEDRPGVDPNFQMFNDVEAMAE